jgi:hypothetical protein
MEQNSSMRRLLGVHQSKAVISVLILLVIGLHAVPVVWYEGRAQTLWPFLTWAMYKNSRPPGPIEARQTRIIGVTSRGQRRAVTPTLVGLPRFTFTQMYTKRMRGGDSSAAHQLISRLNANRKESFVEVRIESQTYRLTDGGIVVQENPVVTFRPDSSPSN